MPAAHIVSQWQDAHSAYLAVRVDEGERDDKGKPAYTEYIGSVPLGELADLSESDQQAALIAAVKAERDRQVVPEQPIPAMKGPVTI